MHSGRGVKAGNQNALKDSEPRTVRLNLRITERADELLLQIVEREGLKSRADAVIWLAENATK